MSTQQVTLPSDLNPNPPSWFATVIATEQASQNAVYHDAVTRYLSACADWVATNTQNRNMGLPLTAPPTPPQLVVIYPTTSGTQSQYLDPVDPTLPIPTLPPIAAGNPSVPFTTAAPAQDAATLGALGQIASDVAAIKLKVGA